MAVNIWHARLSQAYWYFCFSSGPLLTPLDWLPQVVREVPKIQMEYREKTPGERSWKSPHQWNRLRADAFCA